MAVVVRQDGLTGKVTFSDAEKGIVVNVPTAIFWAAWQKMRSPFPGGDVELWSYVDNDAKAVLSIRNEMNGMGMIFTKMHLMKVIVNENYKSLEAFGKNVNTKS